MSDNENYKEAESRCLDCKARFEIWLSMSNFNLERENDVRNSFYQHCSVCRIIDEAKKRKSLNEALSTK